MQTWLGVDDIPASTGRGVVTIGVFDGVHRGHQRIVGRAAARAAELRLPALALTFDPLPQAVLHPETAPLQLTTIERRLELLGELGLDGCGVVEFTREFSSQEPEQFVRSVLVEKLRAVDVVVGENFRFGHGAAGDVELLARLGSASGFMVDAVDLVGSDAGDVPVSSSWIRARIAEGDVAAAARALGRPHRLDGRVVHGDRRGRDLGYPTANLELGAPLAVPADGVYAGWLDAMPAAVSIGTNPTFQGRRRQVEAYVLDRDDLDLYGRRVALDFAVRLREMITFDRPDALAAQMADDVEQCRTALVGRSAPSGLAAPGDASTQGGGSASPGHG